MIAVKLKSWLDDGFKHVCGRDRLRGRGGGGILPGKRENGRWTNSGEKWRHTRDVSMHVGMWGRSWGTRPNIYWCSLILIKKIKYTYIQRSSSIISVVRLEIHPLLLDLSSGGGRGLRNQPYVICKNMCVCVCVNSSFDPICRLLHPRRPHLSLFSIVDNIFTFRRSDSHNTLAII